MDREDVLFILALLTTSITVISIVGKMSASVIKRLVQVQRKLDALFGVIQIVVSGLDGINTYLVKYYNMGDRTSTKELVQAFIDQFNKSEDQF